MYPEIIARWSSKKFIRSRMSPRNESRVTFLAVACTSDQVRPPSSLRYA
jgi:hypothetical protein